MKTNLLYNIVAFTNTPFLGKFSSRFIVSVIRILHAKSKDNANLLTRTFSCFTQEVHMHSSMILAVTNNEGLTCGKCPFMIDLLSHGRSKLVIFVNILTLCYYPQFFTFVIMQHNLCFQYFKIYAWLNGKNGSSVFLKVERNMRMCYIF